MVVGALPLPYLILYKQTFPNSRFTKLNLVVSVIYRGFIHMITSYFSDGLFRSSLSFNALERAGNSAWNPLFIAFRASFTT